MMWRKGYTVRSLAAAAGISPATVQRIATGEAKPRAGTAKRLADALGVDVEAVRELAGLPLEGR